MRVLNVNASIDAVTGGGTAERTVQICRHMCKRGIDAVILTTDIGLNDAVRDRLTGVEINALPCLVKRFYFPAFSFKRIWDLVSNVDIVHLMGHWTFLNACVYVFARRLNKPYVVCPAGALPIFGRSYLIKRLYNAIIGRRIIQNADKCVAVAQNEIFHFSQYGVDEKNVIVIQNGIDADDFPATDGIEFRRKFKLGDSPFLLFMGRLNPIKGPDLLMRAFINVKARLPEYHLVFAGPNGGLRSELEEMARRSFLQNNVHFTGYIAGRDKIAAYCEAEVLVIPSRQEAMSIVVLEAGICGKPVVLTDQCGFNDVENVNGGIVVSASEDGLQNGLFSILRDKESRKKMGQNLKQYVADHFTWDITAQKYIDVYHRIVAAA
jgi:glycosyltransferase involved in cell wall biosynthesis